MILQSRKPKRLPKINTKKTNTQYVVKSDNTPVDPFLHQCDGCRETFKNLCGLGNHRNFCAATLSISNEKT